MATRFEELVKELCDEHNREVIRLQAKISELSRADPESPVFEQDRFSGIASLDSAESVATPKEHRVVDSSKLKSKSGLLRCAAISGNLGGDAVRLRFDMAMEHGSQAKKFLAKNLDHVRQEVQKFTSSEEDRDITETISWSDRFVYLIENLMSLYPNFFFGVLCIVTVFLVIILGIGWRMTMDEEENQLVAWPYHILDAFQLIASAGIDTSIRTAGKTAVFVCGMAAGLLIFAVLVSIITDEFQSLVAGINEGRSKAHEKGHTLLLGWNESTERVVVQLALLRRQLIIQNSGLLKRVCPWLRTQPSTPVAQARIVIMCQDHTKAEMHERIERAFFSRGISRKRTRVGWDVICRVGNPMDPQDLERVSAQNATAIAVMMTENDFKEEAVCHAPNSATFRTILALRNLLFTKETNPSWQDLRIVVPLSKPSREIHSTVFSYPMADGSPRKIVMVQDLSIFVNTLMFTCSIQPGLSDVLMDLMGFEGIALRLRKVTDFPDKGNDLIGKTFASLSERWEDAVPVGIVPIRPMEADEAESHNGMAPDGNRTILDSDRLVFLSDKSLPTKAVSLPPPGVVVDMKDFRGEDCSAGGLPPRKILVCGFRAEWKSGKRFAFRIRETGSSLAPRSSIHFLNMLDDVQFGALMQKVQKKDTDVVLAPEASRTWTFKGNIRLTHTCGDAAHYETLEEVLVHGPYDIAIIIPPVSETVVPPQAQDTRLMSIMCMVRTIVEEKGLPQIHVVGENKLEASVQLALRPLCASKGIDETDFVNVQAIIARALCQALAYPYMQAAVLQLLSQVAGTPCVYLSSAGKFFPYGQDISYADVVRLVRKHDGGCVCIGYRVAERDDFSGVENVKNVKNVFCPGLRDVRSFQPGDCLIIIARTEPRPTGSLQSSMHATPAADKTDIQTFDPHDLTPPGCLEQDL